MRINRRNLMTGALGVWLGAGRSMASTWPDRPVRMVIGYPPGGSADGVARPLLEPMTRVLGQPIVMDYKPGAGGATAAEAVARAAPDGYTLHVIEGSVFTALPHLRSLGFDPMRTLQPIGMVAAGGVAIVAHPSAGILSVADLIRQARAEQGKLAYGTSGVGGSQHIVAEHFGARQGSCRLSHAAFC